MAYLPLMERMYSKKYHSITDTQVKTAQVARTNTRAIQNSTCMYVCRVHTVFWRHIRDCIRFRFRFRDIGFSWGCIICCVFYFLLAPNFANAAYFWLVSVQLELLAIYCCIAEIKFLSIKFLGIADFVFDSIILKVGYPGRCV